MFQSLLMGFKGLFGASPPGPIGFAERRKLVRMRCSYEVKATVKGKKFKATIVDIGLQGLKLRSGQKLKIGEQVSLAPPNPLSGAPAEPVEARVVWVKKPDKNYLTYAGLVFSSQPEQMARSWVKQFLKELGFTPKSIYTQRRFIRAECFLEARFRQGEGERWSTGRIYNLGIGGLLLETAHELTLHEPVGLDFLPHDGLPELKLNAYPVQIQTQKNSPTRLIGMEFRDLSDEQLESLSTYLKRLLRAAWDRPAPSGG